MKRSIRYYFFSSIAAVLLASILILGLIQSYLATSYFREENDKRLAQVVTAVARAAQEGQISAAGSNMRTVDYMAHIAGATVFITDPNGKMLFCTDLNLAPKDGQIPADILEQVHKEEVFKEVGTLGGAYKQQHYSAAAVLLDGNGVSTGYVFATNDGSGLRAYVSNTMSSFVLSAALVLVLSSMLALVLTNRMITPIRRINTAAKKFGEGDYSARVPVEGDNELSQLAITFNEMANSFEATDVSRRSFMGNISHELRTPMTSIKGFIDGMLDGTIPEDQRDRYLTIVSEEVGRLARLTQNMLDISKLEAGEHSPQTTSFDIWGPLSAVFINNEQRLEEKHIRVTGMEDSHMVMVQADEDFVHQVLFNLVDNAIKFTPEKGEITVKVAPGKGLVSVAITNSGDGMPKEVLNHIFDRFYKADQSRGINARGSGLGLHICKVLVGLMGGRIWAESKEGEWTRFTFTLPLSTQKRPPARWPDNKPQG